MKPSSTCQSLASTRYPSPALCPPSLKADAGAFSDSAVRGSISPSLSLLESLDDAAENSFSIEGCLSPLLFRALAAASAFVNLSLLLCGYTFRRGSSFLVKIGGSSGRSACLFLGLIHFPRSLSLLAISGAVLWGGNVDARQGVRHAGLFPGARP